MWTDGGLQVFAISKQIVGQAVRDDRSASGTGDPARSFSYRARSGTRSYRARSGTRRRGGL
jgi:hypothetical protein